MEEELLRGEGPAHYHFGFVGITDQIGPVLAQNRLFLENGVKRGVGRSLQKFPVNCRSSFEVISLIEPFRFRHPAVEILPRRRNTQRQEGEESQNSTRFHCRNSFIEKQK